jgi:hypothetical protein
VSGPIVLLVSACRSRSRRACQAIHGTPWQRRRVQLFALDERDGGRAVKQRGRGAQYPRVNRGNAGVHRRHRLRPDRVTAGRRRPCSPLSFCLTRSSLLCLLRTCTLSPRQADQLLLRASGTSCGLLYANGPCACRAAFLPNLVNDPRPLLPSTPFSRCCTPRCVGVCMQCSFGPIWNRRSRGQLSTLIDSKVGKH